MAKQISVLALRSVQLTASFLNLVGLCLAVISLSTDLVEHGDLICQVTRETISMYEDFKSSNYSSLEMYLSSRFISGALKSFIAVSLWLILSTAIVAAGIWSQRQAYIVASSLICFFNVMLCGITCILVKVTVQKSFYLMEDTLSIGINLLNMHSDPHADFYRKIYDTVQTRALCCGFESYMDFSTINYARHDFSKSTYYVCPLRSTLGFQEVPYTCCKGVVENPEKAFDQCASGVFTFSCPHAAKPPPLNGRIHVRGCRNELEQLTYGISTIFATLLSHGLCALVACVLMCLLWREARLLELQRKQAALPPVRTMERMGLGKETIATLMDADKGELKSTMMGPQTSTLN